MYRTPRRVVLLAPLLFRLRFLFLQALLYSYILPPLFFSLTFSFLPLFLSAAVDYSHGIQSICNPSKIGGLCGFLPASFLSHCLLEYASWSVRCSVKLYINLFSFLLTALE